MYLYTCNETYISNLFCLLHKDIRTLQKCHQMWNIWSHFFLSEEVNTFKNIITLSEKITFTPIDISIFLLANIYLQYHHLQYFIWISIRWTFTMFKTHFYMLQVNTIRVRKSVINDIHFCRVSKAALKRFYLNYCKWYNSHKVLWRRWGWCNQEQIYNAGET